MRSDDAWDSVLPDEWKEWYGLTPQERWQQNMTLWETFVILGGSLEPEPDSQSPFFDPEEASAGAGGGRPGLRIVRRSGV